MTGCFFFLCSFAFHGWDKTSRPRRSSRIKKSKISLDALFRTISIGK